MAAAFLVQILPTDMDRVGIRLSQWFPCIASHWLNWYSVPLIMVKWYIYASENYAGPDNALSSICNHSIIWTKTG